MNCSLSGSSVHGILQTRILEWVAISFSRGSSQPRDGAQVSRIAGRCFTLWAIREAPIEKVLQKQDSKQFEMINFLAYFDLTGVLCGWSSNRTVFSPKAKSRSWIDLSFFPKLQDFGLNIHGFGEGNGNPLQYSCLESPMDGGAW